MTRKEWREVGRQSLYFILVLVAIGLLLGGVDLLMGALGFAQSNPLEGEKLIIILGLWLLTFSMFLGLSPFALDSSQRGMEYLLTLPLSRRRLLWIKFLPRLAAVASFYLFFFFAYRFLGSDAYGGGFVFFSLAYFALFLISFSLSLAHENFIVQFIAAGIAWCGYLALCLGIVLLGFSWKFKLPAAWIGAGIWHDLSYDVSTLIAAIAVFLLMTVPFVLSLFLAFKKFDLRPARAFNRRHLLVFVPLLLLALAFSLGGTYLMQKGTPAWEEDIFVLAGRRLLKAEFPGRLLLYDASGRHRVDAGAAVLWERLLLQEGGRLYLSGYDTQDGARIIGFLNEADRSWRILYRDPNRYFVITSAMGVRYDGGGFVYLRRPRSEAGRPGAEGAQAIRSDLLELVTVDPASGRSRAVAFRSPQFRRYSEPWFIGSDEQGGRRFWLITHPGRRVLRLWEDGRAEDLGPCRGIPLYARGLLFAAGDRALVVSRLPVAGVDGGGVRELAGEFRLPSPLSLFPSLDERAGEIYAERNRRIVRIDLATLAVEDVGPSRGRIWIVPPGHSYYVESGARPGEAAERWKKIYRLQGGRMEFLKRFDFPAGGTGNVMVETFGIVLRQSQMGNKRALQAATRAFAFPDLQELKFNNLN